MATNAERVADAMKTIAHVSSTGNIRIKYERFSADNGVCFIKMDKYKKLREIEKLTSEYLKSDAVQQKLSRVAEEIAREYLEKQSAGAVRVATDTLAVPLQTTGRPQTPVSQPTSPPRTASQPSTTESTDHSDGSADNTPSQLSFKGSTSTAPSSLSANPSRQVSDVVAKSERREQ